MVATNLKAETFSLVDKRASMEAEMNAIIAQLSAPGGPGISGNLVDAEGFPRSDIDIPAIRAQRGRLLALRNDHKAITAKIDENLQVLHSAKLARNDLQRPPHSDPSASVHDRASQTSPMVVDSIARIPFAVIDEISDASPAAEDGLQLGDQIIKFGNVEIGDALMVRLASEAQSNEGHPVSVLIMRQGILMNFTITPRHWHGRGLLGCHFRIL
ncbi:26S proteasome non-ATPase regulatory subunit 9 [Dendrobium catenatum]|uniref:26S proteasome non-ATPase regulatory subunit 9 n=1 Tax=Dendrobium catenatum TaxID=906689 RepID=UPI0009F632C7|nr:26S proteasome non-ATPase regulatory subunit 9 [Dendrobium catenatum]XP_020673526.1 26S proteasome non-ATPase regulatory subunit 9 [Dendrobium catenatum]XP_020673527.1 26S proteasome non-ATPase regulatory subunit 9 [Dendrobium catenatum]XP_020673528.1 26S proteasome non-ATPase regulatory subunit 9 [Dendrobium catenatum]XP_020673529.1 26S proteasome non-ATPase regulatory subunit 9 [Dendrobium catenatum]XP_020673531.1 26S proteasome non-ATPase regulatory subunit 9 [Dendrobium catenatum]